MEDLLEDTVVQCLTADKPEDTASDLMAVMVVDDHTEEDMVVARDPEDTAEE